MNNKKLGDFGEKIARLYLEKNKYKIVEMNFRGKQGEIDIIAKDQKELVFIEVKTRTSIKYGSPVDAVTYIKQKRIYKTAEYYIYKNNIKNTRDKIRYNRNIYTKLKNKNKSHQANH